MFPIYYWKSNLRNFIVHRKAATESFSASVKFTSSISGSFPLSQKTRLPSFSAGFSQFTRWTLQSFISDQSACLGSVHESFPPISDSTYELITHCEFIFLVWKLTLINKNAKIKSTAPPVGLEDSSFKHLCLIFF